MQPQRVEADVGPDDFFSPALRKTSALAPSVTPERRQLPQYSKTNGHRRHATPERGSRRFQIAVLATLLQIRHQQYQPSNNTDSNTTAINSNNNSNNTIGPFHIPDIQIIVPPLLWNAVKFFRLNLLGVHNAFSRRLRKFPTRFPLANDLYGSGVLPRRSSCYCSTEGAVGTIAQ